MKKSACGYLDFGSVKSIQASNFQNSDRVNLYCFKVSKFVVIQEQWETDIPGKRNKGLGRVKQGRKGSQNALLKLCLSSPRDIICNVVSVQDMEVRSIYPVASTFFIG